MDYAKKAIKKHAELKGKISVELKDNLEDKDKLSTYYTPGVGAVCSEIAKYPEKARDYTWINNTVAVISDGSAVLGLGNIGPQASLPVMEGKCMLFKHFAGINAIPIVLDVHDSEQIINTVKAIAPTIGAINLEDIAAPKCFEIEEKLKAELDIPVFHDDQHGTAIVVLAGLINSLKITGKNTDGIWITVAGVGAAGIAIIKLLKKYLPKSNILAVDSKGVIWEGRQDLHPTKQNLIDDKLIFAEESGDLAKALIEADVFIGVSGPDILTEEMVKKMNKDPIVFALSNPNPEIAYDKAKKTKIKVLATGRSDYPNQINNAVVFPGIFKGALDNGVTKITDEHKLVAAKVIASLVDEPTPENIIPNVLDNRLVLTIAKAII